MVILAVALLLFGARRLPEIGASLGKGIREFKRSLTEVGDAVNKVEPEDRGQPPRQLDSTGSATSGEPKRLSQ
jgi:sec-independent protein translocase protein TatA